MVCRSLTAAFFYIKMSHMDDLDLVIIGAGPAALTAAIYTARKKLNFEVLAQRVGGEQVLLTNDIENWPGTKLISGIGLIRKFRKHIENYGVKIKGGQEVVKIEKEGKRFLVKTRRGEEYRARAIIIASGKKPRHLRVPGGKEFEGKGVSYCSICDAPLFRGKTVAVIGGGNAGLESALNSAKYARKIYILELGSKAIGDEFLQEKLKETGKVEFIFNARTVEIKGGKFVTGLIYEDRVTREKKELAVKGVFVHVGQITSSDFIKDFLETSNANEIIIDPKTNQTSVKGIFAAGDVTNVKWKQIVVAAGEGAKAALSAYEYLQQR